MNARDAIQACLLLFSSHSHETTGRLVICLAHDAGTAWAHSCASRWRDAVGGLLVSQLLTLFTTPVIISRLESWARTGASSVVCPPQALCPLRREVLGKKAVMTVMRAGR